MISSFLKVFKNPFVYPFNKCLKPLMIRHHHRTYVIQRLMPQGSCFQISQTLVANTARGKRASSSMQLSSIRTHDGSPNPDLGAWSKMGFPGTRWNDIEADTDVAGGQVWREARTFWAQEIAAGKAWTRGLLRNCKELSEGWGEVKQEGETEARNISQFWTFPWA